MPAIKLTAKRQATFPQAACEDLRLRPGDVIDLEPAEMKGEKVWVLRLRQKQKRDWVGCLGKAVKSVDDHSMDAIRRSIDAGRSGKIQRA